MRTRLAFTMRILVSAGVLPLARRITMRAAAGAIVLRIGVTVIVRRAGLLAVASSGQLRMPAGILAFAVLIARHACTAGAFIVRVLVTLIVRCAGTIVAGVRIGMRPAFVLAAAMLSALATRGLALAAALGAACLSASLIFTVRLRA